MEELAIMRIFVTGGTGYIGGQICRRLTEERHEVRALVRPTSRYGELEKIGVRCFVGDITDRYSMREGMSGADWVVHAAAELDFTAPRERVYEANVTGSANVASLAWKLGVGRVLAVSSIAAFGGSAPDGSPATEESAPQLPLPSTYSKTKREGERSFEEWIEKGLRVNTVYPSLVYGPPSKRGGANSLLRGLLKGRIPAVVGGDRTTSWVFLDDLVEGTLRVMERADPGERYLLAGERVTIRDVVNRVCRLGGVRAPRLAISPTLARLLMAVAAPFYSLRGRRPPFNRGQLESLGRHWSFDDSAARRRLDWDPRGLDEGLPPTIAYLQGGR
jgi:dihydroflavonol-4-reductase